MAFEQYINHGMWFDFVDLHHETFIIALIFAGIILYILRRKIM